MKHFVICLTWLFITLLANAQSITVTGKIVTKSGQPVPFASVVILKDTTTIAGKIADENGSFLLQLENAGTYTIRVTHAAYAALQQSIQVNTTSEPVTLILNTTSNDLNTVTVTAKRSFITRRIDRVVMNVQDNAIATGKSSLDLFRLAPGVFVNNGNISINGVWGTRVMVNGRMLNLQGDDLKNYLTNLKSSDIRSIEIIAHPPAEYDAAGSGGIINIVMKKNSTSGLSGYAGADYYTGLGKYPGYLPYLSLNYRKNKIGFSAGYTYDWHKEFEEITQDRTFTDGGLYHSTSFSSTVWNSNTVKLGATYDISPKQYLAIDYTGQFGWNRDSTRSLTDIIYPSNLKNTFSTGIFPTYSKTNFSNIGLNYSATTDSLGSKFTLIADYTHNDRKSSSGTYSQTADRNNLLTDTAFNFLYPSIARIFTADAKFNKVLKHGLSITVGGKTTITDINNKNAYEVYKNGVWNNNAVPGFNYQYSEKIIAGFTNISGGAAGVEYKLGLRGEQSDISGELTGSQDTTINRHYFNLFPSAFITKDLDKKKQHSLNLSYNKRIKRPSYFELNPYKYFIDNYSVQTGNPFLNPQFTHSIELGYTLKKQYYFGISYAQTKDVINQLVESSPDQKQMTILRKNTGSNTVYTGTFAIPVTIASWWNTSNNLLLTYTQSKGPEFNLKKVSFVLQTEQEISLPHDIGVNLNAFYTPNVVQANIITGRMASVDIGLQKKLWNNKLTAKAAVSDIFYTNNFTATSYYNASIITISQKAQTRTMTLSLVYNFSAGKKFSTKQRGNSNAEEKSRLN
ncbi:MAG: outer membrane beta-barrel protein [Niastella sp.]|uniref:outer membrane beta-barrel protein n=1 Tax=Niastella sp. TaxID=1869183 RepID=UPI00389B213C